VTPHRVFCDFLISRLPIHSLDLKSREVYIHLCQQALSQNELNDIRKGTDKGLGIGPANFLSQIAKLMA